METVTGNAEGKETENSLLFLQKEYDREMKR
jgi:hypothetical protein